MPSMPCFEPFRFIAPPRPSFRCLRLRTLLIGILLANFSFFCTSARATLFAEVTGIVHDTQHRPLPAADVELHARNSAPTVRTQTQPDGSFHFPAVPFGDYEITVHHTGFDQVTEPVTVAAGTSPILHLALPLATVAESITVHGDSRAANVGIANAGSVTPTALLGQATVASTPGAERSN